MHNKALFKGLLGTELQSDPLPLPPLVLLYLSQIIATQPLKGDSNSLSA